MWFAKEFDLILTHFTDVHDLVMCKNMQSPERYTFLLSNGRELYQVSSSYVH